MKVIQYSYNRTQIEKKSQCGQVYGRLNNSCRRTCVTSLNILVFYSYTVIRNLFTYHPKLSKKFIFKL